MTAQNPYSVPFDLTGLTDKGAEIPIAPGPAERAAIAKWLGAVGLDSLRAKVRLKRLSEDRIRYEASYSAGIVQQCVVTLDPVPSHLEAEIARDFRLSAVSRHKKPSLLARSHLIANLDEEDEETLEGTVLDLAAPLLEEISLALDPYPRAQGVAFSPVKDEAAEPPSPAESPFAILGQLKGRDAAHDAARAKKSKNPAKNRGR
jgi:hypothetical protein